MFLTIFITILFLFIPSSAFAWGPLTHVYFGSEIFYFGYLFPAGIYNLLRRYREDYLYGNLMADSIFAKNLLPLERNTHNWGVAFDLFESAKKPSEKAFSLGYISHLAADTVAHNMYPTGRKNIEHTFFELRADSLISRKYWSQAIRIDRIIQSRNDIFLEKSIDSAIFSFRTNAKIFKGMVLLSGLNKERFGDFIDRRLITNGKRKHIITLHKESFDRIIDVLRNGHHSAVIKEDPFIK